MRLALDIGCGERKAKFDGYDVKTLDIRGEVKPDFVSTIDKIPCPDESFDMIHSSHVLEHVKRNDIYKTIKEWRRVLRTGGELILVVPDLEVAAIELLSCQTNPATFDILWGAQNYDTNCHYSGYTKSILEAMIKKYGFEVKTIKCDDRQIFMTAVKLGGSYIE